MADKDAPIVAADIDPPPTDASPPTDGKHRLPHPLVIALRVIGSLLLTIFLAWAILYITKGQFLKGSFERIASNITDREVRVAGNFQFYFNPINLKYVSEVLTVSNPAWVKGNFFEAKKIEANVATFSFIRGGWRINIFDLQGGNVDLQWDRDGRRNTWTFTEEKGKPLDLPLIRRAIVAGTRIRYSDPRMRLAANIAVDTVEARDDRLASSIRFRGVGTARGARFTLWGALLSPNATVAGGKNRLALRINGVRTRADITGTLPGATEIEGAKLNADVRGRNLADAFAVFGVAVPDTRSYRLRSALTKRGDEWRFTAMRGRFGESDLVGQFAVRLGEPRLFIDANLLTRTLDIVDAGPFIGYNPNRLEARGGAGTITQEGGHPHVLPDAPLRVEALRNFDARVSWRVARVRAEDVPISSITLGLSLDNRLLKLSPLNFAMARGTVRSDITINARRDPVFTDYDIRLSPTPMSRLLKGFGVAESGTSGTVKARVRMTGTGNSVRDSLANANGRIAVIIPRGTMWTRNVQLSELDVGLFTQKMFEGRLKEPVAINCGLIAFTVRRGIATADPILIDTQKNVMHGRGGFSFRDETLDLAFRADGKQFSLFSGQSPVAIGGYFAKPSLNVISPELVGRAGAGLGLGVVVTPIAALIAFVDVGDAKSADCGAVLSGATARAQRDAKGRPRDDVGKGTATKSRDGSRSRGERKKQRKKFLGIF
ncbi:AsmA family protein [Sphingomonas koreensis]